MVGAIPGIWLCLLFIGANQIFAVDHGSRLEDIISRKTKESHITNNHANQLLKNAKIRFEDSLVAAKEKTPVVSDDAKKVHDNLLASVSERKNIDVELVGLQFDERKVSHTLKEHGVSDSLVREINNMASSYIPRETIVKHVQAHFPNKDQHEWNDIVISAISAAGKAQPDSLATTKSSKVQASFQQQQFQKAKDSLEYFQD